MSYKVKKKDLLQSDNITGRVIINGITEDKSGHISDEVKEKVAKTDEWEIDMSVNGVEVDPTKFFDYLYSIYDKEVERRAKKMVDDKVKDKIFDSINDLYEINDKIRSMNENLDWE